MTNETWPVKKVRQTFIDFFCQKYRHTFVPSSPTIPHDDPTLLFANAGMNQFKPIFLGTVSPHSEMSKWKAAANSQKCIRAGGKHNDLEDVGKDVYHHTFFEMLGNWSFGDYFKKEAIKMSWELLTKEYGIDKNRLYVTYFGGDEKNGLQADLEAKQLWIDIGVPAERVLPFGAKENFWEMGDQGPCGPCSEIHYDRIGNRDAAALVNLDDPDVLEIWNLVFIQFNREADGKLRPLPAKHVDTGMGLERLVSVLQNKRSNYDTDVFMPLFDQIQKITGVRAYEGKVGAADVDGVDMAYRVVADHARTLTIALSDGGYPSSDGRGYVIRRILRRGVRYARRRFGVQLGNFFPSLVDTVVLSLEDAFPEVRKRVDEIKEILQEEEVGFAKTLDRGEKIFETILQKAKNSGKDSISGEDAFRLYDTFGFPIDLTRLMASERGMKVDEDAFMREQQKAKEVSRAKKDSGAKAAVKLDVHGIAELEKDRKVPKTNDIFKYEKSDISAKLLAIRVADKFVDAIKSSTDTVGLVLDKTNFYAEQGGQEADIGTITIDSKDVSFSVEDVQVYGGYILHVGTLKTGSLSLNDEVVCSYDESRRWPLRNNHTATHILNFALKKAMGSEECDQKGSLVAQDKLRFDYSCKNALSTEQLVVAENTANDFIKQNYPVYSKEVPLSVGMKIRGLRAVFGETYPDPVRVVSVKYDVDDILKDPQSEKWESTSVEFCGGTHVAKTGDIRNFVILEDSSIAKGIRRIIAVTGEEAHEASRLAQVFRKKLEELSKLSGSEFDSAQKSVKTELDQLSISLIQKTEFRNTLTKLQKDFMESQKAKQAEELKSVVGQLNELLEKNQNYYVLKLENVDSRTVTGAVNHMKTKKKPFLLLNVDKTSNRVQHSCTVPKVFIPKSEFTYFCRI